MSEYHLHDSLMSDSLYRAPVRLPHYSTPNGILKSKYNQTLILIQISTSLLSSPYTTDPKVIY